MSLSFLLLQLDGDASHRASLNPFHQMCDVACDLIAKLPAGNNRDFLAHPLDGVEVIAPARVVLLSDDPGRFLYGFGANAALRVEKIGSLASQDHPAPGNSAASHPDPSWVRGLGLSPVQ